MKYLKYSLLALAVIALVAIIFAAGYAVFYFRGKNATLQEQNKEAARIASLIEPSISLDDISCNIPSDAKTQYYSVMLRTSSLNINNKRQQLEKIIKDLGGTIASTGQSNVYDRDIGYVDSTNINATLPIEQADKFISQMRSGLSAIEYLENENNSVQDSVVLKQSCQTNLDYIKNFRSAELLYLKQLGSSQSFSPQPLSSPTPTPQISVPFPFGSVDNNSSMVTRNLTEIRQNASSYKNSIENTKNQLNKTNLNIIIRGIPG